MATSEHKSDQLGYQPQAVHGEQRKAVDREQRGYRPQGTPVNPQDLKPPKGGSAIQPPPSKGADKKS
jgi:hypothetical protein